MLLEIVFSHCKVLWWNPQYLETVFASGAKAKALFLDNEENRARAKVLGYSVVQQMHFEHEIAHTYLAEALGHPYSPVLAAVAGVSPHVEEWWHEEALVLGFQRYLNDGTICEDLAPLKRLDQLANNFKLVIRPMWGAYTS